MTLNSHAMGFNNEADLGTVAKADTALESTTTDNTKSISIAQILRGFGALAIMASLSLFTLQGWSEGNDVSRYISLLGQTGLLALSGFLLSNIVKELKGARVFYMLALGSVVANMTVLGAMLYSFLPLDKTIVDYPKMMHWVVLDPSAFIVTALLSIVALGALSYFSFAILARPIAKPLTLSFFALSLLLVVPLRLPILAITLAAFGLVIALRQIESLSARQGVFSTLETKIAFGMLLMPGIIISARALLLYSMQAPVYALIAVLSYLGLRTWRQRNRNNAFIDSASFLSSILSSWFVFISCSELIQIDTHASWLVYLSVSAIVLLTMSFDQVRQVRSLATKNCISAILSFVYMPIILLAGLIDQNLLTALVCFGINAFVVALNMYLARRHDLKGASFVASILFLIASFLMIAGHAFESIISGNWILLGVGGALLIFGGSALDRVRRS